MLVANLIDLEDFAGKLRELGVALPVGAPADVVSEILADWLEKASSDEISCFGRLSAELDDGARGMVLPSVVGLLEQAQDCIDKKLTSIMFG